MRIRITKGAAQLTGPQITEAQPCASPNHAAYTPHVTIDLGGPWCLYPGEYEVLADSQPETADA